MCEQSLVDNIAVIPGATVVRECGGIDSRTGTECEIACAENYYGATSNALRCVDVDDDVEASGLRSTLMLILSVFQVRLQIAGFVLPPFVQSFCK